MNLVLFQATNCFQKHCNFPGIQWMPSQKKTKAFKCNLLDNIKATAKISSILISLKKSCIKISCLKQTWALRLIYVLGYWKTTFPTAHCFLPVVQHCQLLQKPVANEGAYGTAAQVNKVQQKSAYVFRISKLSGFIYSLFVFDIYLYIYLFIYFELFFF